jgi:hypothetical protein
VLQALLHLDLEGGSPGDATDAELEQRVQIDWFRADIRLTGALTALQMAAIVLWSSSPGTNRPSAPALR